MTFENVYLDFGTKMPKMPVFAQNATPLNYPEPSHMGGLPPTLAPHMGGPKLQWGAKKIGAKKLIFPMKSEPPHSSHSHSHYASSSSILGAR